MRACWMLGSMLRSTPKSTSKLTPKPTPGPMLKLQESQEVLAIKRQDEAQLAYIRGKRLTTI